MPQHQRQGRLHRARTTFAGGSETLTRHQGIALAVIVAIAGALRLAWSVYATKEPISIMVGGDAFGYYFYGKQIAAGGGYLNVSGSGEATAYYPVGYPAILGALFWVVQHTPIPDNLPMAASVLNVVLGTASVALVFALGRRLFGVRVGLVAAALLALWPNLIYYTATTQLETTFIFVTLLVMVVAVSHDWSTGAPSRTFLLGFGAMLGLSAQVRPFILPFLAGLGVAALVAGLGWRKALATMAWPLLTLVLVCTPWTIRNSVAMGSPLPFSSNGGDTLCMDRGPGANGGFRWAASSEACAADSADEVTRNSVSTRRALSYTLRNPDEELLLIPRRFAKMMAEDHDGLLAVESGKARPFLGDRLRPVLATTADIWFFVVGLLSLIGLVTFFRDRTPNRVFVGVGILTLLVVPLLLWGNVRFHVPLLPLIALSAAVPIGSLWERLRPTVADSADDAPGLPVGTPDRHHHDHGPQVDPDAGADDAARPGGSSDDADVRAGRT